MKISTCENMQDMESSLIGATMSAHVLMEDAATRITSAIHTFFPIAGHVHAYLGRGNNAGDAALVLHLLSLRGWTISYTALFAENTWSPLFAVQYARLPQAHIDAPPPQTNLIIDGMLGLGAHGALMEPISTAVEAINALRTRTPRLYVWSIDIPTGLNANTGIPCNPCLKADFSSVIGCVKQGMLVDGAEEYTGRLVPIPMQSLVTSALSENQLLDIELLLPILPRRPQGMYKNMAGHVGIVAGSPGMLGAARLCSTSALKSGAGLVSLYAHERDYPMLTTACPPEIMVRPIQSYADIDPSKHNTLLIGPGLGTVSSREKTALLSLILHSSTPTVLDADGLNFCAQERVSLPSHILATPHHGEILRLLHKTPAGVSSRLEIALQFVKQHAATVVYKGARSIITQRNQPIFYNSSGTPAMATAGQGDVLSGVCAGLMAQGITTLKAAYLGAYLCGVAAEQMIANRRATQETLSAEDTINGLVLAFLSLTPYSPYGL